MNNTQNMSIDNPSAELFTQENKLSGKESWSSLSMQSEIEKLETGSPKQRDQPKFHMIITRILLRLLDLMITQN